MAAQQSSNLLRVTYFQGTVPVPGQRQPEQQKDRAMTVGDAFVAKDGTIRVSLTRDFPATTDKRGRPVYRITLSRPQNGDGKPNGAPVLRTPATDERIAVRAKVAGIPDAVVFGRGFVNGGGSLSLALDTLPLPSTDREGGLRRILEVQLEKAPTSRNEDGAGDDGADDAPF